MLAWRRRGRQSKVRARFVGRNDQVAPLPGRRCRVRLRSGRRRPGVAMDRLPWIGSSLRRRRSQTDQPRQAGSLLLVRARWRGVEWCAAMAFAARFPLFPSPIREGKGGICNTKAPLTLWTPSRSGLLALWDDGVALMKPAAVTIDDAAGQAAQATSKAAAVVIDDAAVTPRYVTGLAPDRELPIVGRIALGSLKNKLLILLPAALALSVLWPGAVTPLFMLGGL